MEREFNDAFVNRRVMGRGSESDDSGDGDGGDDDDDDDYEPPHEFQAQDEESLDEESLDEEEEENDEDEAILDVPPGGQMPNETGDPPLREEGEEGAVEHRLVEFMEIENDFLMQPDDYGGSANWDHVFGTGDMPQDFLLEEEIEAATLFKKMLEHKRRHFKKRRRAASDRVEKKETLLKLIGYVRTWCGKDETKNLPLAFQLAHQEELLLARVEKQKRFIKNVDAL